MKQEVIEVYEKLKEFTPSEIDWLIRNIVYFKQGELTINDTQGIFLSQMLRTTSNLWGQVMSGRDFDTNYLSEYYKLK